MSDKLPAEIARETLRTLSVRKLAPTPENYVTLYNEISGGKPQALTPAAAFSAALATSAQVGAATRRECGRLAEAGSWSDAFSTLLLDLDKATTSPAALSKPPTISSPVAQASSQTHDAKQATGISSNISDLREQIARLLEFSLPAFGPDDAKVGPDTLALVNFCRSESDPASLPALKARLAQFNHRLAFVAEEQAEIRSSLLGMLRLVFENIGELTQEDRWLKGQVEILMIHSEPPLTPRRLGDVKRRLTDVISKQAELKRKAVVSQDEMKRLLASFLEKLSDMSDMSSSHHQRIEACAKRVESARDLAEIAPAIAEAISATRHLADAALKSRDELSTLRRKAQESAALAVSLQRDLDAASVLARHDLLTGALNRKGLQEALTREVARSRRQGAPLSIAFLDIDNFKAINDAHGHPVGDAALSHLAEVARSAMRPQDSLSRFGGEEFVVLMPDTDASGGVQAMARLQRELTRRFFMAGDHQLLITFSAGVAELGPEEQAQGAIDRADQAMYQAKKSGRNKVVAA